MSEQTNSIKSLEFSKIAQFPTLTPLKLTLFTERQSEIIQLHPDSTFCDISL